MFTVLIIVHFIADWCFQTYEQAMNKGKDPYQRFAHCFTYSVFVMLAVVLMGLVPTQGRTGLEAAGITTVAFLYVFLTHFAVDSYRPVYWIRKSMGDPHTSSFEEWRKSWKETRGFIVNVVTDQILHIVTLAPLVYWPHLH